MTVHHNSKLKLPLLSLLTMYVRFYFLSLAIKKEKHLLPQTPFNLLKQYLDGLSVVVIKNNMIVAHVTLWPLIDNWYEYGTIWVHRDYRQHGLAKKILRVLLEKNQDKYILATTTNPIVVTMNLHAGMNIQSFDQLPAVIHRATCVCSFKKTGNIDCLECQIKDKECQLFVN